MAYELEPFKDFIFASEAKVDLGGQRSLLSMFVKLASSLAFKIWVSYL